MQRINLKTIFIFLFLLGGVGGGVVNAQNQTTNGDAVFNEKLEQIQKQIEENEKRLDELKKQSDEQTKKLQETKQQANSLKGQITQFNTGIDGLRGKMRIKEQEIYSIQLAIQKINLHIEKQEKKITETQNQMAALFQEIHKNDEEGAIEFMFKYNTLSTFFDQVNARKSLQGAIKQSLEELQKLKEELEKGQGVLKENKTHIKTEENILRDQKIILEQERVRKDKLLSQTRQQEGKYQNLLTELKEQQRDTQLEIFRLEEQLRQTLDPNSVPRPVPGILRWPAEGILTQGYGCTEFAKSSKYYPTCFHNGVDVAAATGSPIYAADDGMVLHVDNTPSAYGKWITIKHGNGLITLYAHLSLQRVKSGQEVKRGDIIGYMGSTGLSTGSHLHFTVFAGHDYFIKPSKYSGTIPIGATLNPLDYLK